VCGPHASARGSRRSDVLLTVGGRWRRCRGTRSRRRGEQRQRSTLVGRSGPNQIDIRAVRWIAAAFRIWGRCRGRLARPRTCERRRVGDRGAVGDHVPDQAFRWRRRRNAGAFRYCPAALDLGDGDHPPAATRLPGSPQRRPRVRQPAVRWTSADRRSWRPSRASPGARSACGRSAPTAVIVAYGNGRAFRWTSAGGSSRTWASSGVGSFTIMWRGALARTLRWFVGYAQPTNSSPSRRRSAFVWTSGTGMTALTELSRRPGRGHRWVERDPGNGSARMAEDDGHRDPGLPASEHNFMDRGAAGRATPTATAAATRGPGFL